MDGYKSDQVREVQKTSILARVALIISIIGISFTPAYVLYSIGCYYVNVDPKVVPDHVIYAILIACGILSLLSILLGVISKCLNKRTNNVSTIAIILGIGNILLYFAGFILIILINHLAERLRGLT